jgi:hypothetical protein
VGIRPAPDSSEVNTVNRPSWRALAAALVAGALVPAVATADPPVSWTAVPSQPKLAGTSLPNVLSPELTESAVAWGALTLDGGTTAVPRYGYDGFTAPTVLTQSTNEAKKTEPDKNTYLVLPKGQPGADPNYDYGTHFLYQGHESGAPGYITRINLDADQAHRVTLLATTETGGKALPDFDGSTWDPFARRLLFTAEASGTTGGVWAATLGYPSQVVDVSGALGRGGYEGIQADSAGNLWIVEDSGGTSGAVSTHAKQPNSFVYRFVPDKPGDLANGKLQALQVASNRTGTPIVFHAGQAEADITSPDTLDLHTPGTEFKTRWVTIHDTATDGNVPFSANALGKAAGATPFKRPENGVFQPGSGFRDFVFTETGDTNSLTEAGSAYGGFGSLQEISQKKPSDNHGVLRVVYQGDVTHTGFDNITFVDRNQVAVVEDAGDLLHGQRNALDSAYRIDVTQNQPTPVRFLAEGRDPSATFDAEHSTGNDGDNEVTGMHVSDGGSSVKDLLGADVPKLFRKGWRMFWTQQHGDNSTYEVAPAQ